MSRTSSVEMSMIRCCCCDLEFMVPETLRKRRVADAMTFYCPNGHAQVFMDSLGERIGALTKERDFWQAEAERLLAENDKLRDNRVSFVKHLERRRERFAWLRRLFRR
jgi:hypothetical protein